jgi:hypothetical protein
MLKVSKTIFLVLELSDRALVRLGSRIVHAWHKVANSATFSFVLASQEKKIML